MRPLPALGLGLALALASAHAGAFCRSSACPPREDGSTDGHVCHPAQGDDCGVEPVRHAPTAWCRGTFRHPRQPS